VRHAEYYVREATRRGWVTFVWDNHNPGPLTPGANSEAFGLFNRQNSTWWSPAIVNAIMRGAGVTPTLGVSVERDAVSGLTPTQLNPLGVSQWSLESAFMELAA
jgi:hypothetical protein